MERRGRSRAARRPARRRGIPSAVPETGIPVRGCLFLVLLGLVNPRPPGAKHVQSAGGVARAARNRSWVRIPSAVPETGIPVRGCLFLVLLGLVNPRPPSAKHVQSAGGVARAARNRSWVRIPSAVPNNRHPVWGAGYLYGTKGIRMCSRSRRGRLHMTVLTLSNTLISFSHSTHAKKKCRRIPLFPLAVMFWVVLNPSWNFVKKYSFSTKKGV